MPTTFVIEEERVEKLFICVQLVTFHLHFHPHPVPLENGPPCTSLFESNALVKFYISSLKCDFLSFKLALSIQ